MKERKGLPSEFSGNRRGPQIGKLVDERLSTSRAVYSDIPDVSSEVIFGCGT